MRLVKILGLAFVVLSFLPTALSARQYATVTVAWAAPDRDQWVWHRDRDGYYRHHRDRDDWRWRDRDDRRWRDRDDWRWRDRDDRRRWNRHHSGRDDYRYYGYGDGDGYRR